MLYSNRNHKSIQWMNQSTWPWVSNLISLCFSVVSCKVEERWVHFYNSGKIYSFWEHILNTKKEYKNWLQKNNKHNHASVTMSHRDVCYFLNSITLNEYLPCICQWEGLQNIQIIQQCRTLLFSIYVCANCRWWWS